MLTLSIFRPQGQFLASILNRYRWWLRHLVTISSVGILLAPSALAEPAPTVRDAVAALRGGTSCLPLRYDAVVERAAEIINRLEENYLIHTARQEPVTDPLPGLKDLGYSGNKAKLLRGAASDGADAIKVMLLEGYAVFPDCSYKDFGVSLRRDETTGYTFTSVVLAGA